jgi:hypothetical protein
MSSPLILFLVFQEARHPRSRHGRKGQHAADKVPFNQQGYLYNAMVDHPIEVK